MFCFFTNTTFKCISSRIFGKNLSIQCNNKIHQIANRNSNAFHCPYYSKTVTQQSISYHGIKMKLHSKCNLKYTK